MDELRDHDAGGKVFTILNVKGGYHLIQMQKGVHHKTGFRTRYGQ